MGQTQLQQRPAETKYPNPEKFRTRNEPPRDPGPALQPIRSDIRLHQAVYISCEWLPLDPLTKLDESQFLGAMEYVCPAGVSTIDIDKGLRQEDFWISFLTKVTEAEKTRAQTLFGSSYSSEIENLVLSENLQALENLVADDYQTMSQKLLDSTVVISHSPPEDTNFGQIVKSTTMATMGVKVGLLAAGAATGPVLFLYVSGGILTVFLSAGISRWLLG